MMSIKQLEEKLLSYSVAKDVVVTDSKKVVCKSKIVSKEKIKKEVSVLARILINGYCGWPFHQKRLKYKILFGLNKLFDSDTKMASDDFFQNVGELLSKIPDKHLCLQLGEKSIRFKQRGRKYSDVGENIAKNTDYKIEKQGNIGLIGIQNLGKWTNNAKYFMTQCRNVIESSDVVIIDLRGNHGGNSYPLDMLADYLCGSEMPWAKHAWIRGTDEGKILRKDTSINKIVCKRDPFLYKYETRSVKTKFSGIEKPIYILMDSNVCSSAELFITKMRHHPMMKQVGDNTSGCEVYGYYSICKLPSTGIKIYVGNIYRELEAGNIETIGYSPDIRVPDGMDAMFVAMEDLKKVTQVPVNQSKW